MADEAAYVTFVCKGCGLTVTAKHSAPLCAFCEEFGARDESPLRREIDEKVLKRQPAGHA